MEKWNIISSVISTLAAVLAFWQAYKAKSYKDEIVQERFRQTVLKTYQAAISARNEVTKICTPVGKKTMRGVDKKSVIAKVQSVVDNISDNIHRFENQEMKRISDGIKKLITEYKQHSTEDTDKLYEIGDSIREELSKLIALSTKFLDYSI